MKGSYIAEAIERDLKRKKFYKNKKRAKCTIDQKNKCTSCKYQNICEGVDYERDNSTKSD